MEVGLAHDCYFQTGDEKELKDKLQKVLSKDFVPASYSMDEYNWDTIAEQVLDLLSVLSRIQWKLP